MRDLELAIAWRYLRSRRGSRLLSLISVIAIGGVLVGVSALIVIMGVMNGLQRDLREKILVGSPDLRVLPYGSDMRMPEMDGATATRNIRAGGLPGVQVRAPGLPIIALTANATSEDRRVYLESGMDAFLSKPINERELHDLWAR